MKDLVRRISSEPLGLMGLCLVALMVISALFAGLQAERINFTRKEARQYVRDEVIRSSQIVQRQVGACRHAA